MSSEVAGQVRVTDEEHGVDQQLKSQVLDLRRIVDEDERALYVDRVRDPEQQYSRAAADQDWALSIRQYLRSIKRLWDDEGDISGVREYWQEKTLGEAVLVPPDIKDYEFSKVEQAEHFTEAQLRRSIGLPRTVELPRVYRKSFDGLKSVLNNQIVECSWVIQVDDSPPYETVTVRNAQPIPKHVLESAVEAADAFLQQAGLGFETKMPDYNAEGEPGL